MVVQIQVLGPVRLWRGGSEVKLGPPKQRALLALLLAQSGHPISVSELIDALWGQEPPSTAANVIQGHVSALRRLLEPELPSGTASQRLKRDSGGYRLEVQAHEVDLLRFRALRIEARKAAHLGDRIRATELAVEALALWRGPVASGIALETQTHPVFAAVDREHLLAVKEAAEYAHTARPAQTERVLAVLRQAAAHHTLDEVLQAKLIQLLAATGQQAEALEVYQAVRATIADELGLEPGPELRAAQREVLERTPASPDRLTAPGDRDDSDPVRAPRHVRPRQLPREVAAFSGRRSELERSYELLDIRPQAAQTIVFSGMAGVGKTSLAVHWAHRIADRFPDGQLYIDLRGFHTASALSVAEAVRALLGALGVPPHRVPAGLEAQAALYRTLVAGHRILIVLDNARDSEQVRPLLPGTPSCMAVVTSRHQLQGLMTADGACSLTLSPMDNADAIELLTQRLGTERVTMEPAAADEIIALCGRLPLALAIVCARAALNPGFPLSAIADELRESQGSLDAFSGEPPLGDARSVFSWSYQGLNPEAARLFRLLALHPGPDCSVAAAASLTGRQVREVRALLAELVRAHLLFEADPGRFSFHGLLNAYARELVLECEDMDGRKAASARLLDHYLHSAHEADTTLAPHRDRITPSPPAPGTVPERLFDQRGAAKWLEAEHPVLLAAIQQDGRHGEGAHSWRLAAVLELYLDRNGRWQDQRVAQNTAITAAQRQGDIIGQAHANRALGLVLGRLGRWEGAYEHLMSALRLFSEADDARGRGRVHRYWAFLANRQHRHSEALNQYRLADDLYRSVGHLNGQASVHNEVGWTYLLLGEYDKAIKEGQQALVIHQNRGDRNGQAAAWDTLGCAYHRLGQHAEALNCFHQALQMYRDVQDTYLEADTLTHIADTHLASGTTSPALEALRQALALLNAIGHPDAEDVRAKLRDIGLSPRASARRV
ncbi:AfsR family transcriptional regulator [Streptomyces sp. WAC 01325]|uniref:AfsR/SARP family transcriptional regulator n=1 Tax=Streptomyces sp. WAC 01325 TaxID=2203202 RepID=UPI000F89B60F|nr:BTAD domain-containing putative transcriptional regulator [Streptomyces sp. WAC 01325]RSN01277.1 AfsR family transcriptional regulator [Streptomyces sp. WAC 01325]